MANGLVMEWPSLNSSPRERISRMRGFLESLSLARSRFQSGSLLDFANFDGSVLVVGDLHGRIDQLQRILDCNSHWQDILAGRTVLLSLGDLLHEEVPERLHAMDRSLQLLEYFMELKRQAPHHVHFLCGNHDLLHNGRRKARLFGNPVDQSGAYLGYLQEQLGQDWPEYLHLYESAIQLYPIAAVGRGFACVHAGPIRQATREMIIATAVSDGPPDSQSSVLREAIYARHHSRAPDGYHQRDVQEYLSVLGCPEGHLIVGHSKYEGETAWHWDLSHNHHVLTAVKDWLGFAQVDPGHNQRPVRYWNLGPTACQRETNKISQVNGLGAGQLRGLLAEEFGQYQALKLGDTCLLPLEHEAWLLCSKRIAPIHGRLGEMLSGWLIADSDGQFPCSENQVRLAMTCPLAAALSGDGPAPEIARIGSKRFLAIPFIESRCEPLFTTESRGGMQSERCF